MAPDFYNAWDNEERRNFILDIAMMSESIPDACSKIFIVAKKQIKYSVRVFNI